MRLKLYHLLVNRHSGIRDRYHKIHQNSHGLQRIFSWCYLLFLNFCYYILFCHFLDEPLSVPFYEEKSARLPVTEAESFLAAKKHPSIEEYVNRLMQFDVISFDIFDTLIFRPFSEPADLFYFVGKELGILDFKRIRQEAEREIRQKCYQKNGHYEVTLSEIWKHLEWKTGISAEKGLQLEQLLEIRFCYANSFMAEVFQRLKRQKKRIIILSDMYLPQEFLEELLLQNGYSGFEKLYVSCECSKSKAAGTLFELVNERIGTALSKVHVGDNEHSDLFMAKRHGFQTLPYPSVHKMSLSYRPYDMSPVIGGAYRGIVNNYIYSGIKTCSLEYEYGFIYGGLFVLGYCTYIHDYCSQHDIDKILFLSRDGDILKQAYDRLYPNQNTAYVYWSRMAAVKLMAEHDRYDYFRRFLYHKINQRKTISQVLNAMELSFLDYPSPEEYLTDQNVETLRDFLLLHWDEVIPVYRRESEIAKKYYSEQLQGVEKACAVDIGWAGSGAVALRYLIRQVWKLPCEITGLLSGTNTIHNAEPDASEIFLQSGILNAYLYSQAHNRDLLKKHDPGKDYNVFWELLLSSPTPSFLGFSPEAPDGLAFGECDANTEGICEIQKGILDFIDEYTAHFGDMDYMLRVSGRDAYAPMLAAASHHEAYLKAIASRFCLDISIGDGIA